VGGKNWQVGIIIEWINGERSGFGDTFPAYWFEEAGLDGVLPLERQAGIDIAKLREEHPRMRFIGQIDKMTMNKGEAAMRAEFEQLLPTAAKGGFIIGCDHQTPPGVSSEDYKLYILLFKDMQQKQDGCRTKR
jgi:uroporphyrinogen-III decarboxylase